MKTKQPQPQQPISDTSFVADALSRAWRALNSNSGTATTVWGAVILTLVALVGYRYYALTTGALASSAWADLAFTNDDDGLKKFPAGHENTVAGRVARLMLARQLYAEAQPQLANPTSVDARLTAADKLAQARDIYRDLLTTSTDGPVLTQEAMLNRAKAEEILAGVPAAEDAKSMRGSLGDALTAYDAVAVKFPKSVFGTEAAKRAAEIRDHTSTVQAFYNALSREHGKGVVQPEPSPAPPTPPITSGIVPDPPKPDAPKPDAPKKD